jgi:glycosyltransferase involved in cell wall biosynthesis
MFETAFRIVCVSRFMQDVLTNLGAEPEKIVLNPYGPRDAFFSVDPNYRPVVLSVGRFTDIKANYLTLAAFAKTLQAVPEALLVMVGDGELLETCKTLAKHWGISEHVSFEGAVRLLFRPALGYAHLRRCRRYSRSDTRGCCGSSTSSFYSPRWNY